jgi:hypothetical protein
VSILNKNVANKKPKEEEEKKVESENAKEPEQSAKDSASNKAFIEKSQQQARAELAKFIRLIQPTLLSNDPPRFANFQKLRVSANLATLLVALKNDEETSRSMKEMMTENTQKIL